MQAGLPQAKRLLLVLAGELNLVLLPPGKEVPMAYVTWDQLIQLLILIVSLIVLILTLKNKDNR